MNQTVQTSEQFINSRLKRIIALHFDPQKGTPYWLEKASSLGVNAANEINSIADLECLGMMNEKDMSSRPVEDFIPASLLEQRTELVISETGGTTGDPKYSVFRDDEFHAAFVQPFMSAAERINFPENKNWLFAGPTGPHIIGKAARACARAWGAPDPFCVDFDPRWAKTLIAGSFAHSRYLKHLEDQALRIINTQNIGIIFSTPPVLKGLGEKISRKKREAVLGIHFGGLPVAAELRAELCSLFPNAVMLAGFGNTLLGMMPELCFDPAEGISYYPHGTRIILKVVKEVTEKGKYPEPAPPGQRGRVMVHRFDESQLIVNLLERDTAISVSPPDKSAEHGFILSGIRDPEPVKTKTKKISSGFY